MYRLAKPSTFQNTPAIYHHLKSWDDIQNGRHWSSFCEIRWIFYIQKYLTNHGLSVNENYANEQPSILYILEYLYIILTCRRHPLSSPEKSGGTRLAPVRPAIPRPFEGTSASDLDRTYTHTHTHTHVLFAHKLVITIACVIRASISHPSSSVKPKPSWTHISASKYQLPGDSSEYRHQNVTHLSASVKYYNLVTPLTH